jgi:hypothetical protein
MAISLYAALIPSNLQILDSLAGLLAKAKAHCAEHDLDPAELVGARLAEDMLPFGYQVKATVGHSLGAIHGVRAGVYSPDLTPWPETLDGLADYVAAARAELAAVDPAEIDGFIGQDMAFAFRDSRMEFVAEEFLLSFSQPNFYFHATTAYAILRMKGVAIGKRDFIGRPRLRG